MKAREPKATYESNRVMFSTLTNNIYFCPRLKVLDGGVRLVVGKKYEVTADLQPYLQKKYRNDQSPIKTKPINVCRHPKAERQRFKPGHLDAHERCGVCDAVRYQRADKTWWDWQNETGAS